MVPKASAEPDTGRPARPLSRAGPAYYTPYRQASGQAARRDDCLNALLAERRRPWRALGQAENLLTDPEVVAAVEGDSEVGDLVASIMLGVELVARNVHVSDPPRWAQ